MLLSYHDLLLIIVANVLGLLILMLLYVSMYLCTSQAYVPLGQSLILQAGAHSVSPLRCKIWAIWLKSTGLQRTKQMEGSISSKRIQWQEDSNLRQVKLYVQEKKYEFHSKRHLLTYGRCQQTSASFLQSNEWPNKGRNETHNLYCKSCKLALLSIHSI